MARKFFFFFFFLPLNFQLLFFFLPPQKLRLDEDPHGSQWTGGEWVGKSRSNLTSIARGLARGEPTAPLGNRLFFLSRFYHEITQRFVSQFRGPRVCWGARVGGSRNTGD